MTKVYVLESGCYSERSIVGVFSTPELAMAAWHPDPQKSWNSKGHGYKWGERDEYGWDFDADWEDAASIQEYEIDDDPNSPR